MRYRLTAEFEDRLVQYVRAGGFDWVAAEAAGVPRSVFEDWMQRGARSRRQPYRRFHDSVMQARAQARLKAEMDARAKDPRTWLRHGPGREQPDRPGWTNPARAGTFQAAADTLCRTADVLRLVGTLLQALAPFPEARQALAGELERWNPQGRQKRQR